MTVREYLRFSSCKFTTLILDITFLLSNHYPPSALQFSFLNLQWHLCTVVCFLFSPVRKDPLMDHTSPMIYPKKNRNVRRKKTSNNIQ